MKLPATLSVALFGLLVTGILAPATVSAQGSMQDKIAAPGGETGNGTRDLNRQAADAAAAQNAANANASTTYRQGVQDYEAQRTEAARLRAEYEAAAAANRQARADYDAAYARWQADVAACNAGDVSRCAQAAPK